MFWLAEVFNGNYSHEEVRRIEQWARQRRAEAVHQSLAAAVRGLRAVPGILARNAAGAARGLAATGGRVQRWRRKRAAIRELSGLGDHILRDIGLDRSEIRSVVEAMLDGERQAHATARALPVQRIDRTRQADAAADRRDTDGHWKRAA